jgi:regulatory protein
MSRSTSSSESTEETGAGAWGEAESAAPGERRSRGGSRRGSSARSRGGNRSRSGSGLGRGFVAGRSEPRERPADDGPEDEQWLGPEADPESVGRKILLDQLTGQARSRAELAAKLARKRVPPEVADALLDRFEEVGLVDDAAFARDWVESRQASRGLARRALSVELRRKGVDSDVIAEAVSEVTLEDEDAAARELVRRKLRSLSRYDDATVVRRLTGMLARKGYPSSVVFRVVREEVAAAEELLDPDL